MVDPLFAYGKIVRVFASISKKLVLDEFEDEVAVYRTFGASKITDVGAFTYNVADDGVVCPIAIDLATNELPDTFVFPLISRAFVVVAVLPIPTLPLNCVAPITFAIVPSVAEPATAKVDDSLVAPLTSTAYPASELLPIPALLETSNVRP